MAFSGNFISRFAQARWFRQVETRITDLEGAPPGSAAWGDISGTLADQTDLQSALDGKQASGSYAASTHTHVISDTTGLQTALDGKQAAGSYAASTHSHAISDVTGLQTALDGKQASGNYASYTLVATLASDQATAANTTPVTLSGLVFSYEANSKYRIWFMGRVAPAAATTGCGFQFDLSSAVTAIDVLFFHQLANTGTLSGGHSIADDASVGVSSGMPGTSTYPVSGHGLLVTGANTGTAQLRFRSETSAVTTAKAGLTLVVEKIA